MSDLSRHSRWEQLLPLSGVVFTALTVGAAVAFPAPPGGDVTGASDPTWLASHYQASIAQSYVRALAAIAFVALAVAAATAIRRIQPSASPLPAAALVGGAFSGALLLLSQAVGLAAALYVHDSGSPDAARALGDVQAAILDMSSLPAVLLFAAVGLTALHSVLLPRWLAVVTLLGVPFAVLDSASYDGGPFASVGFVGLLYFLGWSLLTGAGLYLSAGPGGSVVSSPTTGSRSGSRRSA
jgi:hypothetical protein